MATVDEAISGGTPMAADLRAGVDAVSYNQTITFEMYNRLVLPIDGFVFWIKADTLSPSALLNTSLFNSFYFNEVGSELLPARTAVVKGSLHYSTDARQQEATNNSSNSVVFTSEQEIQELNAIGPNTLFIAKFRDIRFAFSSRGMFYRQAGLWHYRGNAVYSQLDTQIVDDPRIFNSNQLIVSNSLPGWLAINHYRNPGYPVLLPFPAVPLFPSYLSPYNVEPPFITVHIGEEDTESQQALPALDRQFNHAQLMRDKVRLTTYGLNNQAIMDFVDALGQYTIDTAAVGNPTFGIGSPIAIRDGKQGQNELLVLAQKKVISLEVSYNQHAMRDIARQLLTSCIVDYVPTLVDGQFITSAPIS